MTSKNAFSGENREKFGSRLGFILISAGCAIGLGNVWRFPYIVGQYGGAAFILIYLLFLVVFGLPIMTMEFSVGRGSGKSIAESFKVLQPQKTKWHYYGWVGMLGNYLLMMFYTCISGWMIIYFAKYLNGSILSAQGDAALGAVFGEMVGNVWLTLGGALASIVICFLICSLGLQKGVERVTKWMMVALFALMVGLVVYSLTLENAAEGLKFYLIPSFEKIQEAGLGTVISAAMGQAFFTLSLGIGSIAIFGSYINKERRLLGEAVTIVSLDTSVAIMSGLIIFPACFTYNNGVSADAGTVGAGFLFTTLSSIFNSMPGGRIIGALFFLFMIFAAFSTLIAVFENIISFWLELTSLPRRAISFINIALISILSLPCVFSSNIWSNVTVFGKSFMDLEDFIVSNLLLPIGALMYVLFCTTRYGWGWKNFEEEVNCGEKGIRLPRWIRPYMTFVLPVIILIVLVMSVI